MDKKVFYHENGQIDLVKTFEYENPNFLSKSKRGHSSKVSNYSLEPYASEWGKIQLRHLLNRALIGVSKSEVNYFDGMTLDEVIDKLFTPEDDFGEPVNDYYLNNTGDEFAPPGMPWYQKNSSDQFAGSRHESLKNWMFKHQTKRTSSIHQKIVFFLNNWLVVDLYSGGAGAHYAYEYYKLLIDSSFGSYKDLIYNLTINGKMLWYLNLEFSRKSAPDENYARELQELYTVGKGSNSKFTEDDVVAISKILVGWMTNWDLHTRTGQTPIVFNEGNHDTSDKQLSSFYNNSLIKGRSGQEGKDELRELIDVIFNVEETSYYVTRRIYQFFVNPVIDYQIETSIISPLSKLLRDNNFEFNLVIKTLLKSQHFFDSQFHFSLIKSPLEFYSGILKEFDFEYRDFEGRAVESYLNKPISDNELAIQSIKINQITNQMHNQGMGYLSFPTVAGYAPYYQNPSYDLFWINSYTSNKRSEYGNDLAYSGIGLDYQFRYQQNYISWLETFADPKDVSGLINEVIQRLIGFEINEDQIQKLKNALLNNGINESHWSELWDKRTPTFSESNKTIHFQLSKVLSIVFKMPEFNLF